MATFKAVIRKSQVNKQGLTNIKIQLVHKGQAAYFKTEHYIAPDMMGANGKVKAKHPNHEYISTSITRQILEYEEKLLSLKKGARTLSFRQIKQFLDKPDDRNLDFFTFAKKRLDTIKARSQGTFSIYSLSIEKFKKFVGNEYLPFQDISKVLLEKFEMHCRERGNSTNTISVYIRAIRAIFNDAIEELNKEGIDPVISNYPFRYYKIKNEATKKRNLPIDVIRKIRYAKLTNKYEIIARDVFMLSIYLIGINMKDLFYLHSMNGDRIEYTRAKTGTKMSIKVEPEALEIINRYRGEKYLLRFADYCSHERDPEEKRKKHLRYGDQYLDQRAFTKLVNSKLKDIAKSLRISEPISTYYARHSWATIARNDCGISKDDIALCLGHKDPSKKVTDLYLNEESKNVDTANTKVLQKFE